MEVNSKRIIETVSGEGNKTSEEDLRSEREQPHNEMPFAIGVDIVEIARFDKYVKSLETRFCERVFTLNELEYLKTKKAASMAGLFAAKEAVAKALGTGFRGFYPHDIEIQHSESGAPHVVFHGKAKQLAHEAKILISISHTKTLAVAVALKVWLCQNHCRKRRT